ncbi:MAG: DUF116 domain-containing protein [Thermoplasmata archaeon]
MGSSSESRKRSSSKGEPKPCAVDPDKLAMVSDYLKRTLSDRPYAFIIESLSERLDVGKGDRPLDSVGVIHAPADFDHRLLLTEKTVAFVPYCCKPFDCPSNEDRGRKSNTCQAITDKCEHPTCSISRFIKIVKRLGIKEFFVIDTDSELIKWLAKKRAEGYTQAIGAACEFAVCYALEVIHGQLGYDGLILIINGDKCRTKEEYAESDESDRGRLTFIDEWTLMALEDIVNEVCNGLEQGEAANGTKAVER